MSLYPRKSPALLNRRTKQNPSTTLPVDSKTYRVLLMKQPNPKKTATLHLKTEAISMKKVTLLLLTILAALAALTLTGCNKAQIREETKDILIDVFKALPGGLKEANEKVFQPAIEDAKKDAKDIYDTVHPDWEEAFPSLAEQQDGSESTENP